MTIHIDIKLTLFKTKIQLENEGLMTPEIKEAYNIIQELLSKNYDKKVSDWVHSLNSGDT
jgi:hypothetical protein